LTACIQPDLVQLYDKKADPSEGTKAELQPFTPGLVVDGKVPVRGRDPQGEGAAGEKTIPVRRALGKILKTDV